jgi:hypothetical protein
VGTTCITSWDSNALSTKDGLRPDTAFEAKCRTIFDETTGRKSQPGAPSGGLTVNGVTYEEDIPIQECAMAELLLPAIKKAGKNLTWEKVYDNMVATSKLPLVSSSDGSGGLSKKKLFAPTKMHLEVLSAANADTPQDANGLYNGCPIPMNCWVPQIIDGQEWFPISNPKT